MIKNPDVQGRHSLLFTATRDHGRHAFEAYIAIYRNDGKHVILAAPTLDALAEVWEPIAEQPLDRGVAQHVLIIRAPEHTDRGQGPGRALTKSKDT